MFFRVFDKTKNKLIKKIINKCTDLSGFTLLEVIIVIIIVGILASLALPRFMKTTEYSRAQEALSMLSSIRRSIQRCYLFDSSYSNCNSFSVLDFFVPPDDNNPTHFGYGLTANGVTFTVTAIRTTRDNGDGSSTISINQDGDKGGTGVFSNVR